MYFGGYMERIDTGFLGTRLNKTLVYALNHIWGSEYKPSKDNVDKFLSDFLPDYKEQILSYLHNNLYELNSIEFMDSEKKHYIQEKLFEKVKEINYQLGDDLDDHRIQEITDSLVESDRHTDFMNCDLYNVCHILIEIKLMEESIDEFNKLLAKKEYDNCATLCGELIGKLSYINQSVGAYVMEADLGTEEFSVFRNYLPGPRNTNDLFYMKSNLTAYNYLQNKDEFINPIFNILAEMNMEKLREKITFTKIQLALCCIKKSPQYSKNERILAQTLMDIFLHFLSDTDVHLLFINNNDFFNTHIPFQERMSSMQTTRLHCFFNIINDDIFSLRIDMPHKGVSVLHLNMEECIGNVVKGIGIPYELNEKNLLSIKEKCEGKFHKLFYICNNLIWFRSDFCRLVDEEIIDENNKMKLREMNSLQSHLEIPVQEMNEDEWVSFINEFANYLEKFNIYQLERKNLTKENVQIVDIIKRMRKIIQLRKLVLCLTKINNEKTYDLIIEEIKKVDGSYLENDIENTLLSKWYDLI